MIPDCAYTPIQVQAASAGARAACGQAASSAAAAEATEFAGIAAYFKERQARETGRAGEAGEGRSADANSADEDEPSKVRHPLALSRVRASSVAAPWLGLSSCVSDKDRRH